MNPWADEKVAMLRRLWSEGLYIRDVASRMGETVLAIQGQLTRRKIKRAEPVRLPRMWTVERVETLRRLAGERKTAPQIAVEMKLSQKAIRKQAKELGLPLAKASPQMTWTPDQAAFLEKCWKEGTGGTGIARLMGLSVNQVNGKADRMGLPKDRVYPEDRKRAVRDYSHLAEANRNRVAKPRAQAGPKEAPNVIPMTARPWLTRRSGECTYPYGSRGEIHSCCLPVWNGSKYCEAHHALCHEAPKPRRAA